MLKTALDLVPILEAIDVIKNSKLLSKEDQATVLREIAIAVPAPVFCKQCPETLSIINKLVETTDGSQTKQPTKETRKEHGEQPTSGNKSTGSTTQDARGSSKVSSDDPKGKVARKASGSSRRSH